MEDTMDTQSERQTGVVKWFDPQKGYGFIEPDNGDNDIFVHANDLNLGFGDRLNENDRVEFEVKEGPKGMNAVNVTKAGAEEESEVEAEVA